MHWGRYCIRIVRLVLQYAMDKCHTVTTVQGHGIIKSLDILNLKSMLRVAYG